MHMLHAHDVILSRSNKGLTPGLQPQLRRNSMLRRQRGWCMAAALLTTARRCLVKKTTCLGGLETGTDAKSQRADCIDDPVGRPA